MKGNEPAVPVNYHLCTICKKNHVDAENGYDTCYECMDKQ